MPIYEYTCPACDHLFEELVRSEREARQVACPKCGQRQVQRRLSVFAAHAAAPKPSRRSRRGRRRPRQAGAAPVASAQPQPKPLALSGVEGAPAKVEAAKQPQRRPRPSRRRRPPRARPVEAQASAAPPTPAVQAPPAAPPPKRMGLLRRGARTIARVVREGD